MENIHKQIEKIKNKDDFLAFLNQLAKILYMGKIYE